MLKGTSRIRASVLSSVNFGPHIYGEVSGAAYFAINVFPTPDGPSIKMFDFSTVNGEGSGGVEATRVLDCAGCASFRRAVGR